MVSLAHSLQSHTTAPARRKVVGLCRVSTTGQGHEDRGGLPRQRAVIAATIARQNLDCLQVYEIANSGTDVLRNPTILEILQMVRVGIVTGLVVADLDRLFRPDQPTDYAILQVFKDTGATIFSGDTEYNLAQKDSALFANIRSAISGFELALMKERQHGAKEAKRKEGKCPTNRYTLPLGVAFDRQQQKFVYTDQIGKVVELFRLFDSGLYNYKELGRRTGISYNTARNLLRNELFTGWRNITEKRGPKTVSKTGKTYRKKVKRAENEVIRTRVFDPGAVSQELFDRVQVIMSRTVFNHVESRKKDEAHNFGAGIAFCGYCGEPLYARSGKHGRGSGPSSYTCKSNWDKKRYGGCKQPNLPQRVLDPLIENFATEQLTDPVTLSGIISDALCKASNVVSFPVQGSADSELNALRRREKRLLDAMESGDLTLEEFRARREAVRREIAAVQRRQEPPKNDEALEIERFARLIVKGATQLQRIKEPYEKMQIIHSLFSRVMIKDTAIVAFQFREGLTVPADLTGKTPLSTIDLETPFLLSPPEEPLPAGHRKCSCCKNVKPETHFYKVLGQCKPCLSIKAHDQYLRRKEAKKAMVTAG